MTIPKFRAWFKQGSKMVNVATIDFLEKEVKSHANVMYSFDEIELMQSTGLVDENGKEVFEGDIVKLFDKDLYVVEWSSQEASYKLIPVDKQWSDCYFSNYENITKIIEVIGNVWENQELVEED
ncbi:YopX family protein [Streptococcus gallolyticus]|uniref:YopX family protein n=1 Tax=Streptococcus gallolyticus TaxID=315405 RepID=UPI001F05F887|nr:YopX family protein [Streptococcus gallolyticus]MCH1618514.1 YopX family protein [Streptococcus gallolyticus]